MSGLREDIAAYDQAITELKAEHGGEWALFRDGRLVGVFPDFEAAATDALDRFGSGPYLIRQIGVEAIQLSSTMVFRPAHANSTGGV